MHVLKLLAILLICIPTFAVTSVTARTTEHLELKQIHRIYGKIDLLVTRDGARLRGENTDYTFVCQAPDWDMVLFSDKRKLVARRARSDWSKKGIRTALSIMDNSALHRWPRTLVGSKNYHGLRSAIYAFPYKYENGYPADLKHGKFGEYLLYEPKFARPEVESFIQALYDCPPAKGIPLKLAKYAQGNSFGLGLNYNKKVDTVIVLETVSAAWKNTPVNISVDHTKSYKRVSESDIVVKHDDLSDAFQHLVNDGRVTDVRKKR